MAKEQNPPTASATTKLTPFQLVILVLSVYVLLALFVQTTVPLAAR